MMEERDGKLVAGEGREITCHSHAIGHMVVLFNDRSM